MSKQKSGHMDCIVVGGCADGTLLRGIRYDAEIIELRRPEHIKPLENSLQTMPDIVHESDRYEVHPLSLCNTNEKHPAIFGIAVIDGESLTWAFTQLVVGFVENSTAKLISAGVVTTN